MVSYYNSLSYPQKHSSTNLPYTTVQPWSWQTNYPPPNQFVGDVDSPHSMSHHPIQYYNPHMFSSTSTADWHSAENFAQSHLLQQHHHQHYQHHQQQQQQPQNTGGTLNDRNNNNAGDTSATEILPSPPITVSGSEMSSPGGTALSSSPHPNMSANANSNKTSAGVSNSNNPGNNTINSVNIPSGQSSPDKSSPFYDWMKKPTYSSHPMPGPVDEDICTSAPCLQDFTSISEASGKTRTKDKYRVVYTDFQRLELEKEYCTSRYITIRRKSELAQALILSERQVKIWFQNRRAKERKQHKKREDMSLAQHPDLASYIDTKPKLEPGIHHLQHSLHSMTMNMPMSLHHHHSMLHHGHHHPLGVPPPPQHHLHQPPLPLSQSAPTPGPSTVSLHNSSPPM